MITDYPAGLAAGVALPVRRITPTEVQLFLYSAATWNPHRIHYDFDYAKSVEGYEGVLVHGPLLGSWMLQALEEWSFSWGNVESMAYRTVSTAVAGDDLEVRGETEAVEGDIVEMKVAIAKANGGVVSHGTAKIKRKV